MCWVSFCISTYKRPDFLKKQLTRIAAQTFTSFEVIISDNDPAYSAHTVVESFDDRFKYFPNGTNLGMIDSFNKSIDRSNGEYILMITDDDYIDDDDKLQKFNDIHAKYPGQLIYINCKRKGKEYHDIEFVGKEDFAYQLLSPRITKEFLWSDAILNSSMVKRKGGIPDFNSPHLADHALLAICGSEAGGVFINKPSYKINNHQTNFSKSNLNLYYIGCSGFYHFISSKLSKSQLIKKDNALVEHLNYWAVENALSLRGTFLKTKNTEKLRELKEVIRNIFDLPFMRQHKTIYKLRLMYFNLKNLKKNVIYSLHFAVGKQ